MDKKYFKRWGEFYLDQLSRSLNQQIKPNFKDSACPFGGDLFTEIVDKASDIFDTLPPPKPSLIHNLTSSGYGATSYRSIGTPVPQILSNSHTINVSGYWAITLGHDYKVGILAHNYFGSKKIIEDLMHKPGWNDGHVIINDNQFVRDHIDGEIVGLTRDLNTDIDNWSLAYNLFG